MKTYYELLAVETTAGTEEIKKAFRREIARYHPDKVQHLGKEFQEMAAGIAADLTEAYRILMDPALRAKYDADLKDPVAVEPAGRRSTTPAPRARGPQAPAAPPPPAPPDPGPVPPLRPASAASIDLVRRAAMSKVTEAIGRVAEMVPAPASGFDGAYVVKAKKGLFKKPQPGVRLLVRIVPEVNAASIKDCWPQALKATMPETTLTLLLIGSGLAPAQDLAAAVTEQRRRARGGPVLVPVDVRDWGALFPPDTPEPVRALLRALQAGR